MAKPNSRVFKKGEKKNLNNKRKKLKGKRLKRYHERKRGKKK